MTPEQALAAVVAYQHATGLRLTIAAQGPAARLLGMLLDDVPDAGQVAYMMATPQHETAGTFEPIEEIWGPTKQQLGYEGRADLGNDQPGDGYLFRGRGFVQATGRRNARVATRRLRAMGIETRDLEEHPEDLLLWPIAYPLLHRGMLEGWYTGKALPLYVLGEHRDFRAARKVINWLDRADLIAGYARGWLTVL